MFREYQANFTCDDDAGTVRCYVLYASGDGQWHWINDAEFGPNETTLDLAQWLTRVLSYRLRLRLR